MGHSHSAQCRHRYSSPRLCTRYAARTAGPHRSHVSFICRLLSDRQRRVPGRACRGFGHAGQGPGHGGYRCRACRPRAEQQLSEMKQQVGGSLRPRECTSRPAPVSPGCWLYLSRTGWRVVRSVARRSVGNKEHPNGPWCKSTASATMATKPETGRFSRRTCCGHACCRQRPSDLRMWGERQADLRQWHRERDIHQARHTRTRQHHVWNLEFDGAVGLPMISAV